MSNTVAFSRYEVIEHLQLNDSQFESLLNQVGIADAEMFSEDQLDVLVSAKRSFGGVSRSRGVSASMGEPQPATSFQGVLEAQAALMRKQAEAALEEYNNQVGEVFQYVLDEARDIQNHWAGEFQRSLQGTIDTQAIPMDDRPSLPEG
jgi:hypothetical protein